MTADPDFTADKTNIACRITGAVFQRLRRNGDPLTVFKTFGGHIDAVDDAIRGIRCVIGNFLVVDIVFQFCNTGGRLIVDFEFTAEAGCAHGHIFCGLGTGGQPCAGRRIDPIVELQLVAAGGDHVIAAPGNVRHMGDHKLAHIQCAQIEGAVLLRILLVAVLIQEVHIGRLGNRQDTLCLVSVDRGENLGRTRFQTRNNAICIHSGDGGVFHAPGHNVGGIRRFRHRNEPCGILFFHRCRFRQRDPRSLDIAYSNVNLQPGVVIRFGCQLCGAVGNTGHGAVSVYRSNACVFNTPCHRIGTFIVIRCKQCSSNRLCLPNADFHLIRIKHNCDSRVRRHQ